MRHDSLDKQSRGYPRSGKPLTVGILITGYARRTTELDVQMKHSPKTSLGDDGRSHHFQRHDFTSQRFWL